MEGRIVGPYLEELEGGAALEAADFGLLGVAVAGLAALPERRRGGGADAAAVRCCRDRWEVMAEGRRCGDGAARRAL